MDRQLTHEEARSFYDRFGSKQDLQRFYENPALERLEAHARFEVAHRVVEFGCGTGAFAKRLLQRRLPPDATYLGLDVSSTMVRLTSERLAPWAARARVEQTAGEARLPVPDRSCDRVVSAYVLDVLEEADIRELLAEAKRVLVPGGLLCLVSMTEGNGPVSWAFCRAWSRLHAWRPALVGGCRPLRLEEHLGEGWQVAHREVVCAVGVCSEVLVAAAALDA